MKNIIQFICIMIKISKKEYFNKMNELDEAHFNSEYYKNFINCYIDVIADLNDILTRHPYIQKKKYKYSIKDYIFIFRTYYYNVITLNYIRPPLMNIMKMYDNFDN